MLSSQTFVVYAMTSTIIAEMFQNMQILLFTTFGFNRIISYFKFFTGRMLFYSKHTVNLVSVLLFISTIVGCIQVFNCTFKIMCQYKFVTYGSITFQQSNNHLEIIMAVLIQGILPTIMIMLHVSCYILSKIDVMKKKKNEHLGLSNLENHRVLIVSDEMKDKTAILIYVIYVLLTVPNLYIIIYESMNNHDLKDKDFKKKVVSYFEVLFSVLSIFPFVIFQEPVRYSLKIMVQNLCSHFCSKPHTAEETLGRTDTLTSIRSIDDVRTATVDNSDSSLESISKEKSEIKIKLRGHSAETF